MDWADQAVQKAGHEGIQRKDPLCGMDIIKEYEAIEAGTSKLCSRIQSLVIQRYVTGQ